MNLVLEEEKVRANSAWLNHLEQFPKLNELFTRLSEPMQYLFSLQIDIFAGKYPDKNPLPTLVDSLPDCQKIFEFATGLKLVKRIVLTDCIVLTSDKTSMRIYFSGLISGGYSYQYYIRNSFEIVDYIRNLGYEPKTKKGVAAA